MLSANSGPSANGLSQPLRDGTAAVAPTATKASSAAVVLYKVKVKQLGGLPFFREVTLETLTLVELRKRIAMKFKCEIGAIKSICVLPNATTAKSNSIQNDDDVQQHCHTGVELTFLKNSGADTGLIRSHV